jgi:hypothetical protein
MLLSQDQPRPPVYNVEDYAGSLRKFGKRGPTSDVNNGDSPEPKETEMTLKEFTSVTELLEKLSSDLKLAYFRYLFIHSLFLFYYIFYSGDHEINVIYL